MMSHVIVVKMGSREKKKEESRPNRFEKKSGG
ncbi:Protein CBG26484 [Caenorhabditis briggsae]|uniref:Protein CBG26484 n=1 Tax=Caenorhabditis briggsae TaxID=6238 RepID=B6IH35_CAEBR|nr:Protein CBG26484 [Caenorhabditis briggsae]CAR99215.1 Protein CBG26484 [Caenorhabditis briggsae]